MKFSIVTPVLNGMPDIRRCVGSVRNQRPVEVEHIVEDGCSTDGTVQWLSGQADVRVKSGPDQGMYDAINRGWLRADGDVLSWLNADEQYTPGALRRVEKELAEHPDADIIFGDCILVNSAGEAVATRREIPLRAWYVANGILYAQSGAMFFRRRVVETWGGIDSSRRIAGDMAWVLRLLKAGARIRHIPSFLVLFTVSGRNLSLDPRAADEIRQIRAASGGYRSAAARSIPRALRCLEKALRGCYQWRRIRYGYVLDETGRLKDHSARTGPFWRWA